MTEPPCAVSVRGARTQMRGGGILGYYWYIETDDGGAEASTFGDALRQLELLLFKLEASNLSRRINLVGIGQGATMALALALVWPELIAAVVAVDGGLPANLSSLPLELGDLGSTSVLFVASTDAHQFASAVTELQQRNGRCEVETCPADVRDGRISQWLGRTEGR